MVRIAKEGAAMMTTSWIARDGPASHGGTVISGTAYSDIDSRPIASIGDLTTDSMHKGVFLIVAGDMATIIDGRSPALHGDKLACGCYVRRRSSPTMWKMVWFGVRRF